jgi:hypothetical protein
MQILLFLCLMKLAIKPLRFKIRYRLARVCMKPQSAMTAAPALSTSLNFADVAGFKK